MSAFRLLFDVLSSFPVQADGWTAQLTRTELTRRFCHHTRRAGAAPTKAIYDEWIPLLVNADVARIIPRTGKPAAFAFRLMCAAELENQLDSIDNELVRIRRSPESWRPGTGLIKIQLFTAIALANIVRLRSDQLPLQAMLRAIEPGNPALPSLNRAPFEKAEPNFRAAGSV